ncbi:KpsF/GutQ family sugar-phosphate isomerase [Pedosphaera parvula]|uniref:KpsF/GutQ family protein n=1 Tax=Pedosphaera parvula (strain Ellin514) TaxID=320771 RepID=B9XAX4_PEDPL|nr:KpsF/GutQ family sugar-phosphate isomerase [Pedosphaera parvula]EEF63159.1 KpsF/GutQ family protein [Pedosphaera parvula Ellin514]
MLHSPETAPDKFEQMLGWATKTMLVEAEALKDAAGRLGHGFLKAADLILSHPGKVVVSGLGKSGIIGKKLVATLCSTGTPAVFLHPAEALHGDLGVYSLGDPTILISKSGTTAELLRLVPMLRQFESPLIGIFGNTSSHLARRMDAVLDASVRCEADACNLAPTSSTIVAMALGDALASALMQARNFGPEDFARFHAGGQLGRNLLMKVRDVLHPLDAVACVGVDATVKDVVIGMTQYPFGAACVIRFDGVLEGLITDGDLRRALQEHDDIRSLPVTEIMTASPVAIRPEARLKEALQLMEERELQISVLPVVDAQGLCLGLIRIHDIYQSPHVG